MADQLLCSNPSCRANLRDVGVIVNGSGNVWCWIDFTQEGDWVEGEDHFAGWHDDVTYACGECDRELDEETASLIEGER